MGFHLILYGIRVDLHSMIWWLGMGHYFMVPLYGKNITFSERCHHVVLLGDTILLGSI